MISELKNTLGRMDCISKDSNKCTVDNVFMTDEADGNFGANFDLPKAIAANTTSLKQQLVSMKFKGKTVFIDGDGSLDDYFDKIDRDDGDNLFPDGDDGNYINDTDRPTDWPWQVLPNGSRRLQDATNTTDPPQLDSTLSTYISNPVVCKTLGSAILWEGLSPTKYPIYVKDSLLNTNDDFDFGEFQKLP